jgi:hypothetical protein
MSIIAIKIYPSGHVSSPDPLPLHHLIAIILRLYDGKVDSGDLFKLNIPALSAIP